MEVALTWHNVLLIITGKRDQTNSFIDAHEVIGRDANKRVIIKSLLDSNSTENEHD